MTPDKSLFLGIELPEKKKFCNKPDYGDDMYIDLVVQKKNRPQWVGFSLYMR